MTRTRRIGMLALAAAALTTAGGARADAPLGQELLWPNGSDQITLGGNAEILIEHGRIAFYASCGEDGIDDSFAAFADVYIVAGIPAEGASLVDVAAAPNTVGPAASGGLIVNETLGFTAPAGTIGEGTYSIVYDECQNGILDGEDAVFEDALTVEITADVPELDLTEIKAKAAEQELQAVILVNQVTTARVLDELGFSSCEDDCVGRLTAARMRELLLEKLGGFGRDPYQSAAVFALNAARKWKAIKDDPPDPLFAQPTPLTPVERLDGETTDAFDAATIGLGNVASREDALAEALLHSLERYQGADAAGADEWALSHARAIREYALLLADELGRKSAALDAFGAALAADPRDFDALGDAVEAARAHIVADGFGADQVRLLRNHGLTPAEIDALRADLTDDSYGASEAEIAAAIAAQKTADAATAATLAGFADEMAAVVAQLTADPGVSGVNPLADAGGPYDGSEGASLPLDGTDSSAGSGGPIAAYEWDLDVDGAFDDATGATPTFTPAREGATFVGLKVTGTDGSTAVDYARLVVSDANRAPALAAAAPALLDVELGDSIEFGATAFDPDGDAVAIEWTLDAQAAATGEVFEYAPSSASEIGLHLVRVSASDPHGQALAEEWFVSALAPDRDADGWRANADCDDANGNVHPSHAEVIGNGVDDDCDAATPDSGSAPTADFDFAPERPAATSDVQFTDRSTDPDAAPGAIVGWSWDFGDGATSDERNPVHAFATSGTYTVTLTVRDGLGLESSVSREIVVEGAAPTASFTVSPDTPVKGEPVTFTDTSTDPDGPVVSWLWDFGDGFGSTSQHPSHVYASSGTYTVTLVAGDADGNVDTATREITVAESLPRPFFRPTQPNGGDVAASAVGASVVAFSSEFFSNRAAAMLDRVGVSYWIPATTSGWVKVALADGGPYVVDGFQLKAQGGLNSVREFEVAVSTTGTSDSDFTTVLRATVTNLDGSLQTFSLPRPVVAKYVLYRVLNAHGAGHFPHTDEFHVLTDQVGDPTVTFENLSADAVSYEWDFGDGTTSTEASPTHTFPGRGVYTVKLTARDAEGHAATFTLDQRVLAPVLASFAHEPGLREAVTFAWFNTTPATADAPIVSARWRWPDGSPDLIGNVVGKGFADSGVYDVTITATDAWGHTGTATRSVTVANLAPRANIGPGGGLTQLNLLWGEEWVFQGFAGDVHADMPTLRCRWEWGDGTPVFEQLCSALPPSHIWADPGEYTLRYTATDKDGGTHTATATVTVAKWDTFVTVHAVPGSLSRGKVDVVARLWQRVGRSDPRFFAEWRPYGGQPLTVSLAGTTQTLTTGADGSVSARLPVPIGGGTLSAAFAATSFRHGSTDSDVVPGQRKPAGDLVFVIDESGSMAQYHQRIKDNVALVANRLAEDVDLHLGLVGFGDQFLEGSPHVQRPLTDDLSAFTAGVSELTINGGIEPGFEAIHFAMGDAPSFRPSSGVCTVLIGDEPPHGPVTKEQALAALRARNSILFSIVTNFPGPSERGYIDLANESGGQAFDIEQFVRDPQPVLAAIADKCAVSITSRPDLTVEIDDGTDSVRAGDERTYTVTVRNDGAHDVTGVRAEVRLPASMAFVSASDGAAFADGTVSWPDVPSLFAGDSFTRTVTARVVSPLPAGTDTITVDASVADDGANGAELTPADNAASDTNALVNTAPVASDVAAETESGAPVTVTLRARDADGDELTYSVISEPQHGSLTGTAPDLVYTPDAQFAGDDSFTYAANDGAADSNVATATITVTPANDPPLALDDAYLLAEDGLLAPAAFEGVLANDGDPDGDPLTAALVGDVRHGQLTLNPDGSFSYQPEPDFHGSDSFSYLAGDGAAVSAPATVTLTVRPVNDPPEAADDEATTAEETPVQVDVLANDTDADGDALALAELEQPAHGSAVLTPAGIEYTPAPDFVGSDSFRYTVADGQGASASAQVRVEVTPANDPPLALDDVVTGREDTELLIPVADLLVNDEDRDGDALALTALGGAGGGTVDFGEPGTVVFRPLRDRCGPSAGRFEYTVSDGFAADTGAVAVDLECGDDAPDAVADAATVTEDAGATTIDVLANDTDPDGGPITVVSVMQPQHGAAAIAADGARVTYTPDADYCNDGEPTDDFSYTLNGGSTATVAMTVTCVAEATPASGVKFEDANANGARDAGEAGLDGWTIEAYADDGDGVLGAAEGAQPPAAWAATDGGGAYTLTLDPGAYVLCEAARPGWLQTTPDPATNDACASAAGTAPAGHAVVVEPGRTAADNDFGNVAFDSTGVLTSSAFQLVDDLSPWTIADFEILLSPKNVVVATNPGQFYSHHRVTNTSGSDSSIRFAVAWPCQFVAHGAQPIHAYVQYASDAPDTWSDWTPRSTDIEWANPNTSLCAKSTSAGPRGTGAITATGVPAGATVWVTVHLDYALKGTTAPASSFGNPPILYSPFTSTATMTGGASDVLSSMLGRGKKVTVVYGRATDTSNGGVPLANVWVRASQGSNAATARTDASGHFVFYDGQACTLLDGLEGGCTGSASRWTFASGTVSTLLQILGDGTAPADTAVYPAAMKAVTIASGAQTLATRSHPAAPTYTFGVAKNSAYSRDWRFAR